MTEDADAGRMAAKTTAWMRREEAWLGALSDRLTALQPNEVAGSIAAADPSVRAIAESLLLLYDCPALMIFAPQFSSLYRLLRTDELRRGAHRGGATLLVGSGHTYPEALAAMAAPPPEGSLARLAAGPALSLMDALAGYSQSREAGDDAIVPPALVPGTITALDPDYDAVAYGRRIGPMFGIDDSNTGYVGTTLGQAMSEGRLQAELDSVIWNRADPYVVHPDGVSARERRAAIHGLLYALARQMKAGGRFVFTVGTGNTDHELRARLRLVEEVTALLPTVGLRVVFKSSSFASMIETLAMHDELYGAVAGVIATKLPGHRGH